MDHQKPKTTRIAGGPFIGVRSPFVRVGDVSGTIRTVGIDELPIWNAEKYGAKVSQPFDSLITMKGTVGRVAYVSQGMRSFVYSPQVSYWRSRDHSRIQPRWLRYWLESPEFLSQAFATKGATDMADYINLRDQRRMTITVPPILIQRKIAAVLSAYDDFIENNNRRIKILEEMAQRIYREWFIDFRYPGHEEVPLVPSELGPIPQWWQVRQLEEVATVDRGLSWDRAQETESGGLSIITIPNVQERLRLHGMTQLTDVSSSNVDKYSLAHGDTVLVGSNGNPERVGHSVWIPRGANVLFASFLMRVRADPTQIGSAVLRMQLKDPRLTSTWRSAAIGSTSLRNIRVTALRASSVLVPDEAIRIKAEVVLRASFDLQDALDRSSVALRMTRDLLLPQLISGNVDLSGLEVATPEAVA